MASAVADVAAGSELPRLGRVALLASAMLTVMAGATIAPSQPAMAAHFGGTQDVREMVQLVMTLPGLAIAITGPFAGLIADRLGRIPLLKVSIILYAVAGAAGPHFDNLHMLLVSRLLLGVAVAGVMTSTTALIADLFEGQARQSFMGMQGAFMSFGGVVFIFAGGYLARLDWSGPFYVYLLALLILPAIAIGLRGVPKYRRMLRDPLIPHHMPWAQLALIYIVALLLIAAFYVGPTQLPFLLSDSFSDDPALMGFALGGSSVVGGVVALNFRRIRRWLGHSPILALNVGLMGVGLMLVGLSVEDASVWLLASGLFVMGLGSGLGMANLNEWISGIVPQHVRGRALGGLTMSVFLGGFLSPLILNPVIAAHGMDAGWIVAGVGAMILAAVAAPLAYLLRRRWRVHDVPVTTASQAGIDT